jgi:hypothetical protein
MSSRAVAAGPVVDDPGGADAGIRPTAGASLGGGGGGGDGAPLAGAAAFAEQQVPRPSTPDRAGRSSTPPRGPGPRSQKQQATQPGSSNSSGGAGGFVGAARPWLWRECEEDHHRLEELFVMIDR